MKIKYYGHSCFALTSNDYTIVLDPFKDVEGFDDIDLEANEVICSHSHMDHAYVDGVKINVKDNSPFINEKIHVYHDECKGEKRGKNDINILLAENKKIVHLGDLGHVLDEDTIEKLKDTDVLMIPIGGFYTIDYKQAIEIINEIKSKQIIPMHYKDTNKGLPVLGTVEEFMKAYGKDNLLLLKGYNQEINI